MCGNGGNTIKKGYLCKRIKPAGNKFDCLENKKTDECDTAICDNAAGY